MPAIFAVERRICSVTSPIDEMFDAQKFFLDNRISLGGHTSRISSRDAGAIPVQHWTSRLFKPDVVVPQHLATTENIPYLYRVFCDQSSTQYDPTIGFCSSLLSTDTGVHPLSFRGAVAHHTFRYCNTPSPFVSVWSTYGKALDCAKQRARAKNGQYTNVKIAVISKKALLNNVKKEKPLIFKASTLHDELGTGYLPYHVAYSEDEYLVLPEIPAHAIEGILSINKDGICGVMSPKQVEEFKSNGESIPVPDRKSIGGGKSTSSKTKRTGNQKGQLKLPTGPAKFVEASDLITIKPPRTPRTPGTAKSTTNANNLITIKSPKLPTSPPPTRYRQKSPPKPTVRASLPAKFENAPGAKVNIMTENPSSSPDTKTFQRAMENVHDDMLRLANSCHTAMTEIKVLSNDESFTSENEDVKDAITKAVVMLSGLQITIPQVY